jgi:hypothetical protein
MMGTMAIERPELGHFFVLRPLSVVRISGRSLSVVTHVLCALGVVYGRYARRLVGAAVRLLL